MSFITRKTELVLLQMKKTTWFRIFPYTSE